jgi:glycosyltransferase involved in cell wall biosynthesis
MRICHVTPHLPPDQGANALLPAELAQWAHEQGHDVSLLSYEPAQGGTAATLPFLKVTRLPRRARGGALSRALRIDTMAHARRVSAALDAIAAGADVLHLHSNGLIVETAARWAAARGVPYILTLYGTEIWHYKPRWPVDLFTRAYRGAATVTFYSRKLRERAEEFGLSRPQMEVVYPTVPAMFAPRDSRERGAIRHALGIAEPLMILNVKRLHELAGQRYLIDAFGPVAAARQDVRLVICGTGPLESELKAQARAAGLAERVTFAGLVPNDVIARYAALADVFALPSLLEALPTVAVEALASGTPVVSADHPGGLELHELFGDDVRLVPRSDVGQLTTALRDAIDAPRRVGAATLSTVQRYFGEQTVRAAYDALYGRLIRRRT